MSSEAFNPSGWSGYFEITCDQFLVDAVTGDLYYPLALAPAEFWANVKADGGDIRVVKDGLAYSFQVGADFNAGAEVGSLFFDASALSASADTTWRIYAGNAAATMPAAGDTLGRNGVWDSSHNGVLHLDADPTGSSPQFTDSTGNGNNGTASAASAAWASGDRIAGKLGSAALLVAADVRYIQIAGGLPGAYPFWVSCWVRPNGAKAECLWSIGNPTQTDMRLGLVWMNGGANDNKLGSITQINDASAFDPYMAVGTTPTTGAWKHVVCTWESATVRRIYENGALVNTNTTSRAFPTGLTRMWLGRLADSTPNWETTSDIDDFRWGVGIPTAGKIATQYNNQSAPASFWTTGAWVESEKSDTLGAVLGQAPDAGFEERPRAGGVGLLVELSEGGRGALLEYDTGQTQSRLHNRLMLRAVSVAGGGVTVLAGRDTAGDQTFDLVYDPTAHRVTAHLATGASLAADLPEVIDWCCVELGVDATAGEANLWLNGVLVDHASGDLSSLSTRTLWFGAPYKAIPTVGVMHLDEWAIADGYIGPVIVEPVSDYADDPSRWMVVYNRLDADSCAWAAAYRQRRGVPLANLVGLDLPTDETIDEAGFAAMRDAIATYRTLNRLEDQALGVLLGHGVPGGYVRADAQTDSIAAQLQRIDGQHSETANPNAASNASTIERPTNATLGGDLMTARIDGPTSDDSIALLDRTAAIEQTPLASGDDDGGLIWLDPYAPAGSLYELRRTQMLDWADGLDRQRLRLPLRTPQDPGAADDAEFDSIDRDAFFWGWDRAAPPSGFFAEPAGRRVFAVQLRFSGATGSTLRDTGDGSWAAAALGAGYAACAFSHRAITSSAVPLVAPFFEALRRGWTLAEAWRVANPLLRSGLTLVGDPLMTVAIPRAGWDVFGPFESLDRAAFSSPIAHLRSGERTMTIPEPDRPADGDRGVYVVRRLDDLGRSDSGVRLVGLQRAVDRSLTLPCAACWPLEPGWSPSQHDGEWVIEAYWPDRFDRCGVARVELVEQVLGESEQVADATDVTANDASVRFERTPVSSPTRYRVRAIATDGGVIAGPWSAWLTPATVPMATIELI